jgi:hypothetical protein
MNCTNVEYFISFLFQYSSGFCDHVSHNSESHLEFPLCDVLHIFLGNVRIKQLSQ